MQQHSRSQAAYPGEWAFILCAKLVAATPAHRRAEKKRETESVGDGNEGFQELLEKVAEGEITGTKHLYISITLGLSTTNGTRFPVITPAPIRDWGGDSDYSDPTNATLGPSSDFPELDEVYGIVGGNGPNKGAIAGAVIGALLFISILVALLFIFRHRIRQKIIARKYNCMGPTPDPLVTMRYDELKPSMAKRGPLRSLFSSKAPSSRGTDMGLPPPAFIRYSTTSRQEPRNPRYIGNSLFRGDDTLGSPPDRGTFYNARSSSSSTLGSRSRSPPQFRFLFRTNSERFPVAIPCTTSALSSTSTSPTLEDEFFHALSQPKLPLQAPQPVAVIPAFLISEAPVEPRDSHCSWSTAKTP
ncbi:hypothetical protein EV426DRAFT_411014 [Tirmania nivea]|nr:hypothetical protein EV426DRAFT_411014 [Tirmania nivea]